jgi:glutaconyl-CoA decarboxylase
MSKVIGKTLEIEVKGQKYVVQVEEIKADKATVTVDGQKLEVDIRSLDSNTNQDPSKAPSCPQPVAPPPPPTPVVTQAAGTSGNTLDAAMPGVVIKIIAQEGAQVSAGEVVLILEAMKMENEIRSNRSGKIDKVLVTQGQQVQTGDPLMSFC